MKKFLGFFRKFRTKLLNDPKDEDLSQANYTFDITLDYNFTYNAVRRMFYDTSLSENDEKLLKMEVSVYMFLNEMPYSMDESVEILEKFRDVLHRSKHDEQIKYYLGRLNFLINLRRLGV